jgi:multidrug resistance efflux pump
MSGSELRPYLLTGAVVLAAVLAVLLKYWDYLVNPWTRDGHVNAQVVQISPRVTGPIVSLKVSDNEYVEAGDLLFEIDPRTFEAAAQQAAANYDQAQDAYDAQTQGVQSAAAQVESARSAVEQAGADIRRIDADIERNRAEYARQQALLPQKATSQRSVERAKANLAASEQQRAGAVAALEGSRSSLVKAQAQLAEARASLGAQGDANASLRAAQAALRQAELNLEFTRVTAPVSGYVTNLNLRIGSTAVASQPLLALIDADSFWVHGFFRENSIGDIRPGNRALVTLMTYPDSPLEGYVDSIGWGIAQQDGSTGAELLPNVSPTFEWIRLAQRIPVRVHVKDLPDDVELRVGATASVLVMTGEMAGGADAGARSGP